VARGVAAALECHHRAQARRDNRDAGKEHPLWAHRGAHHAAQDRKALAELLALSGTSIRDAGFYLFNELFEVKRLAEVVDSFCADTRLEHSAVFNRKAVVLGL